MKETKAEIIERLQKELSNQKTEMNKLKQQISILEANNKLLMLEKNEESRIKDRYLFELLETRKSISYKAGLAITKIPRMLRGEKKSENEVTAKKAQDTNIIIPDTVKVYPYMISVVTAVYNTAPFLDEMIESIVKQKADSLKGFLTSNYSGYSPLHDYFENVWELILVDDGSTDGSSEICDKWAEKYPQIKVVHKENGGVSAARNAGIDLACGKYITFTDSDDKLSGNVFEECIKFFEEHFNDVTLVSFPNKFFDAQTGDHWTNTRFSDGKRIIDSLEEWDKPLYFTNSTFFKLEDIKGKICFDTSLCNGEDTMFLHQVYYHGNSRVGVIPSCTYWYRRRSKGELSAIQAAKDNPICYTPYVKGVLKKMIEDAQEAYGIVPKYVQYAVMGQLQWKLRQDPKGEKGIEILGEEGYREYVNSIKDVLNYIDCDVIASQKQIYREHIIWALKNRDNTVEEQVYDSEAENITYKFNDISTYDEGSCFLKLDFMSIENNVLKIVGAMASLGGGIPFVYANGEKTEVKILNDRDLDVYVLGEFAMQVIPFEFEYELDKGIDEVDFRFAIDICGKSVVKNIIRTGKFMPISRNFAKSYYMKGNWSGRFEDTTLKFYNLAKMDRIIDFEAEFEKQITWRHKNDKNVMEALENRKEILRRKAWIKDGTGRQIWLVSDQVDRAGDNGEAFFQFLSKKKVDNVDFYFVISDQCDDYERMKEYGEVLVYGSKRHIIMHMLADCIISAHADEFVINPVWRNSLVSDVYRDFLNKKYVFLQHGIIKDDLSAWLNKYNKNVSGFICGAIPEAQSILDCDYYYSKENVWLTGLARYDKLYHDEKKYITIMPTWRKYLSVDYDSQTSEIGSKRVNEDFPNSDYYFFYNQLINSSRLLEAAEKYGYTICFMPHPSVQSALHLFARDERVKFFDTNKPYSEIYAESNMVITDYSSSVIDFAWLKKPVAYVQFDKERFFSGEHTYKQGYFDYDRDGFGEVTYSLEDIVSIAIAYMENGCQLKPEFEERINKFFGYFDYKNCERIYEKTCELMMI